MRKCIYRFLSFGCSLLATAFLVACSDFLSPVESSPEPNEYSYNYWLLQKTFLYSDWLNKLPEEGDSVQALYRAIPDSVDRYTRYTEPAKSEAVITSRNTSIITGDIGVEFLRYAAIEHPLFINRVYPDSPADRAGVPKYGNVLAINGVELIGADAYNIYKSVFNDTTDISLEISFDGNIKTYDMKRETIYAPTVFIDTIDAYTVINIREFKPNTYDRENGTYGELKRYLDSTANDSSIRILDLRNNPGGHVDHCLRMADLFVKEGTLSTRVWYTLTSDGKREEHRDSQEATAGHSGESGKFVMLANTSSASCSEIFIAAIHELTDIPLAGTRTFGKGIGQTTWKTPAGGIATITSVKFITPKGNSYHKTGIIPDYTCEDGASIPCAITAAERHFGTGLNKKSPKQIYEPDIITNKEEKIEPEGGAIVENIVFW